MENIQSAPRVKTELRSSDLERGYLTFRVGRSLILRRFLTDMLSRGCVNDPVLFLSRLFCRLKSADSVLEKIRRKGIEIESVEQLHEKIVDILGFRAIVDSPGELLAVDRWIRSAFEVVSVLDTTQAPDEFGQRGIEYSLRWHEAGAVYPFELQLRTFLQHIFSVKAFHLFHKQPPASRLAHKEQLNALGAALAQAESSAAMLPAQHGAGELSPWRADSVTGLTDRVHVVLIEIGEQALEHHVVQLTGNYELDHETIARTKIALYEAHPKAAVVEASCIHMMTYLLNEPHVIVPPERVAAFF